jgi:kumamolisin
MRPHEYTAAYGASAGDIQAIHKFAQEYNLQPQNENAAARTIELEGSVADLSRAFGVSLQSARIEDKVHRVRQGSIMIPEELAGKVIAVLGLDNRPAAQPHFKTIIGANATQSYTPIEVARLYNFPTGVTGSGQTIAIIELDGGFTLSDVNSYFTSLGLTPPAISVVLVDGQTNTINRNAKADMEVALDIEVAGAVAPGANQVVYFALNTDASFLNAINKAIHATPTPTAISISWGGSETGPKGFTDASKTAFEQSFQDAANLGIVVTVATGDNGSFNGTTGLMAQFPATAPHVLACGGTRLLSTGSTITAETGWSGSGGGVSVFFNQPSYQSTVTIPARPAGGAGRGIPDVAGDGDPDTGYKIRVKGSNQTVGGTSAVAPLWAGLVALYGQSMGRLVGFLHPKIYQTSVMSVGFRDITSGNNDSSGAGGKYSCVVGWDAVTGLGSPKGTALLNAIKVPPPTPHPTPPTPHPTPPTPHPTPPTPHPTPPTPHPTPPTPHPTPPTPHPTPPTPHPTPPTPHPTPPTPHPTPPTPHPTPPTPTPPTPTPTPDSGGTGAPGGGPAERLPTFEFPPLPPPVPPPVPVPAPPPVVPAPPSIIGGLGGGNSVALVAIVGLGAVMGMVAAAGIVATVAISKDKT